MVEALSVASARDLGALRTAYRAEKGRASAPFASFKRSWQALNFSRVHLACPRAEQPVAYTQGLLHAALVVVLDASQRACAAGAGVHDVVADRAAAEAAQAAAMAPPAATLAERLVLDNRSNHYAKQLADAVDDLCFGIFCLFTLHQTQRLDPRVPVRVSPESCLRLAEAKAILLAPNADKACAEAATLLRAMVQGAPPGTAPTSASSSSSSSSLSSSFSTSSSSSSSFLTSSSSSSFSSSSSPPSFFVSYFCVCTSDEPPALTPCRTAPEAWLYRSPQPPRIWEPRAPPAARAAVSAAAAAGGSRGNGGAAGAGASSSGEAAAGAPRQVALGLGPGLGADAAGRVASLARAYAKALDACGGGLGAFQDALRRSDPRRNWGAGWGASTQGASPSTAPAERSAVARRIADRAAAAAASARRFADAAVDASKPPPPQEALLLPRVGLPPPPPPPVPRSAPTPASATASATGLGQAAPSAGAARGKKRGRAGSSGGAEGGSGGAEEAHFKGVSWDKGCNKWKAQITIDGKRTHVGSFIDEVAAARAYDEVAASVGRPVNFPIASGRKKAAVAGGLPADPLEYSGPLEGAAGPPKGKGKALRRETPAAAAANNEAGGEVVMSDAERLIAELEMASALVNQTPLEADEMTEGEKLLAALERELLV